jgi:hypothetical protein
VGGVEEDCRQVSGLVALVSVSGVIVLASYSSQSDPVFIVMVVGPTSDKEEYSEISAA